MKKLWSFILLAILFLPHNIQGGVIGTPDGKPAVRVGDKAPLVTEELRKAHGEGKVILLMFGNPWHCQWCEKVWHNIQTILPKYNKDAVAILKTHQRVKWWEPNEEGKMLGRIYGIIGEPWLFLIDKEGIVRHIFMGFSGIGQIEEELKKVVISP